MTKDFLARSLRAAGVLLALVASHGRLFAQELTLRAVSQEAARAADAKAERVLMPVSPLNEEVLRLPGDRDRPVELEVTFYKPPGAGPFPLAIINHGANAASDDNRGQRQRFGLAAYYFLSRGYAVAMPMMRGFAGSGGEMLQMSCNLYHVAKGNGRDIRAVIEALARRPDIDGGRVVVSGQSFGGWNTLGLGTAPPPGVRALVLFNATLRSSGCAKRVQDQGLIDTAGSFGAETHLPSLWFYGENDTTMPTATWHSVFDTYKKAGARARLVDVGTVGSDSHQFLSNVSSLPLWVPELDAFLAGLSLPSAAVYPGYLPTAFPPPTQFAAIGDVAAVPYLGDKGRAVYDRFLKAPKPRALVLAPTGALFGFAGVYDPLGKALQSCSRVAENCHAYAVDDTVVWTKPDPGEPTRIVNKAVAHDAATTLGSVFAIGKDCAGRGRPKITVSSGPSHGTVAVTEKEAHPAFAPSSPLSACNAAVLPSVSVTYTPQAGFVGGDVLTIEEVGPDGRRVLTRFRLQVS